MSADPPRPVARVQPAPARRSVATVAGMAVGTTAVFGVVVVWLASALGVRSVAFAFLLNWSAMCWMGIVSRVVRPPLPEAFFRIRGFERSGRIYELVGVRIVKLAVRRGPLHWFNPHLRMPAERTPEQLQRLEQRMREPEAAHTWLFVAMVAVTVHALARGWRWAGAWTMAFNVALNAYPVMLQRYNRRWLQERTRASTR